MYAETFHCHPQDVGTVNLQWYERWRMWQTARNSRAAHEVRDQTEDWTQLPPETHTLIRWAEEKDE